MMEDVTNSSALSDPPASAESKGPATVANPDGENVLTVKQREKIVESLKEKGAVLPCPRCGNDEFALEDAIFKPTVEYPMETATPYPGVVIPTVVTSCARCGFLALHACGTLGLMDATGYRL